MQLITRSLGRPSRSPTAARMRAFWPGGRCTGRSRRGSSSCSTASRVDSNRPAHGGLERALALHSTTFVVLAQMGPGLRRRRGARCGPMGRPAGPGVTSVAPAPSANSAAVPRSRGRGEAAEHVGADHQHGVRGRSTARTRATARTGKPVQAAPTSIAPAPCGRARRLRAERRWGGSSAVMVASITRSTPAPGRPAGIERLAGRRRGEVGEALALAHVAALVHAGAVDDPPLGHARALGDHVVARSPARARPSRRTPGRRCARRGRGRLRGPGAGA